MAIDSSHQTLQVLTIAGSDSGGGAGIQADLKTVEAHGVHGLSVVTAITAQNSRGVSGVLQVTSELIRQQLEAVFDDFQIAAVKIGMLGNAAAINVITQFLESNADGLPIVLDPVMIATSGDRLIDSAAEQQLRQSLIPLATLITPNLHEAEALLGISLHSKSDLKAAAETLIQQFPDVAILLKGGHLQEDGLTDSETVFDFLKTNSSSYTLAAPYLQHPHKLHGGGCTLSSAIAVQLAMGHELPIAVHRARAYLHAPIENQPGDIGHSAQCVKHATDPEAAFIDTPVRLIKA